ncbi:MAG: ChaN family lipoprotein, partial [Thermodesulfobacteriota bacterium]|nr:ChaN family lipoprotein [Thermodesulfobacteriota bacterium]
VLEAVRQGGLEAVAAEDRIYLPSEVVPPGTAQQDALLKELERHQNMRKGHATRDQNATAEDRAPFNVEDFLLIQSLWDSKMAESAARTYEKYKRPVVILAGSGHVEQGWGIAGRLKAFDPEGEALSVVPWRGGAGLDPGISDLFFYCPQFHKSRLGFSLEFLEQKALVTEVEQDSKAFAAGVQKGDVILTAQGLPVTDLWVLHKAAIQAKKENTPLEITVLRQGKGVVLLIEMSKAGGNAGEDVDAGTP